MAEENKAIEWPGGANVADDFDFLMVGKDGQPIMKIPKEKLNEVIVINGEGIKAVAGGASSANPTILAPGPAGQNRKMEDVVGWFVNGTGNPLVATGTPWEAPAGFKNTNWWDGTAGTWSLGSSVALPQAEGTTVLNPEGTGVPQEQAAAKYIDETTLTLDKIESVRPASKNLFNKDDFRDNTLVNSTTGAVQSNSTTVGFQTTQDIDIPAGTTDINWSGLTNSAHRFTFYDQNGAFISPQLQFSAVSGVVAIPENSKKYNVTFKHSSDSSNVASTFMLAFGDVILQWEPYQLPGAVEKLNGDYISALYAKELVPTSDSNVISKKWFDDHRNDGALKSDAVKTAVVGKNLFNSDPATFFSGYINADDNFNFVPVATVYKTSDYVPVYALTKYTISGFSNKHWKLGVAFYDKDKVKLGGAIIPEDATSGVINTPSECVYIRFTITTAKAGDTTVPSNVQVEAGQTKTDLEMRRVVSWNIATSNIYQLPATAGRVAIIFGDSITEQITRNSQLRDNWNTYASAQLMWDSTNFAKSGAGFCEASVEFPDQKLSVQIDSAVASEIIPDIIIVSLGTNDLNDTLGSYDSAMSKSIGSLDMNIVCDAARANFYRLRNLYPNATFYYALPLQRADRELSSMLPLITELRKLAQRYGFIVIEATNESGILKDFEVNGGQGRDLYDGLHPNRSGQIKVANCYVSRIKSTYQVKQ